MLVKSTVLNGRANARDVARIELHTLTVIVDVLRCSFSASVEVAKKSTNSPKEVEKSAQIDQQTHNKLNA